MICHFRICFMLPLASIVLLFLFTCVVATGQTGSLPHFAGPELPLAPHQKTPWELPVSSQQLPANFVTATAALFEHGLADPRGCEYREVEVMVGSVWGGAGIMKTHAWVIPAAPGQRFAVAWNGLTYPIISSGSLVNLREDILVAVKADEEARANWEKERAVVPFYRFRSAWPESQSLSTKSLLPLKASLLLRLGEVDLAQRVWETWTAGMSPGTNDDSVHLKDPYLMLAADWVWAMFDRAVTAHMRGDDQLALLSARALVPIQTVVEKEVARRGLNREYDDLPQLMQGPRYLRFLQFLSGLLSDQERRARERVIVGKAPRKLAVNVGFNNFPSRAARIVALIRDLDEVRAYQSGQPGGVDLSEDQTVKALIAEGEEAVEPLLDVLESDQRLTRSVHFWRDFSNHRSILGAHEAAYVALTRILKTSFFGVSSTGDDLTARSIDGRRAVVGQIRQYWKEYGKIPIEERWYRVLQDDHQSLNQWLQAASRIVELADIGELRANVQVTRRVTFPHPPGVFTFRGEGLRQRTDPTVSQLLIRRMKDVIERKDKEWLNPLRAATDFAVRLANWDGKNHLDELREITSRLENMFAGAIGADLHRRPYLIGLIVQLYVKRQEIADPTALPSYAKWLPAVKPEDAGDYSTQYLFELAARHTNDPAISRALESMFSNPASAWFPLIQKDNRQSFHAAKLIETPLLNASAFREQVLQGLKDKSIVGVLRPHPTQPTSELDLVPENTYGLILTRGAHVGSTVIKVKVDDRNVARPLTQISFRACDVFAWELSGVEGMPEFEVYWTEAARDVAIEAAIRFLRDHRGSFVFSQERFYKLHYASR